MGKSSCKKKRSRLLSQGKKRKKGKTLSKSFSKLKGIRRRNDSDSSADDSMSSGYELSSSSSEDDNRNQKSRSRLRKIDVKSSKKDRRVFSSSGSGNESESDQETARPRKRKRSNKKDIIEPKKKNQRKKARRDETISDSSSCSTTSDESESDRRRSRSGRKKKVARKMEKRKKKRGYRSRSSSTSIVSSGSDDYQFEENTEPKRLRSVIIVVNDKEGMELDENEDKDRIIYDSPLREINGTDDCNDEREESQETILSDDKTQNDLQNHIPDLAVETNTVEEISNEAVNVDVVASADDLESILRQKALENLKKFRGDLQTSAITSHADVKHMSDAMPYAKAEEIIGQTNSTKVEAVKVNAATKPPVLQRVSSHSAQNEETRVEKNNKLDVVVVPDLSNKKCSPTASAIGSKAKLAPLKEVNIPINPAKKTEIVAGVDNPSSERAESVEPHSCKNNGNTVHKASGSASVQPAPSLEPGLGNVGSNKDQSKEGSQLESKTMSVMRGGQLVEVNYQVYIPKKASALGRRPLKR